METEKRYTAVGAYIYAGGFSVGMRKHFNILAHLEEGNFGVATVKDNFPGLQIYTEPDRWPTRELRQAGVDVCYANPPCAPWSLAATNKEVTEDQTQNHEKISRLLTEIDPTIWVWESVTQAYLGNHPETSQEITDLAMGLGFTVYHFLHDVKFMGLPQQRRRVFTVASKLAIPWLPPTNPIITCGEVLEGITDPGVVQSLSKRYLPVVPLVKQGGSLRHKFIELHGKPAPGFLIRRARPEVPSRTLLGGPTIIHPTEHRLLGHKEYAALCGYPSDYTFNRKGGDFFKQVARAVTPTAGDYLGSVLKSALDNDQEIWTPQEWEINYMAPNQKLDNLEMQTLSKRLR